MRMAAPEFGPISLIGVRVSIAAAFLLPLLLASGRTSALLQNSGPLLLVGVFNSALPFCLFAFATLSLTAGFTAVINAAVPMFTAIVGVLWLREKLARVALLGLLVGLAGVVLLVWDKMTFSADGLGWGRGGRTSGFAFIRSRGQLYQGQFDRPGFTGVGHW